MNKLQIGDLVWFKDYFWIIESITVHKDENFDQLYIKRKFRKDGSFIKSKATTFLYRCWTKSCDLYFQDQINEMTERLKIYNNLINT